MVSRRHFLSGGLAAATALTFGSFFRMAAAGPKDPAKKLIIVFNYGGWDPTLVFDPKEPSSVVDMAPGRIKRYQELPLWIDDSRPEIDKFFSRWGSLCAVVNGIAVRSLVHEECVEQVLTGVSLEEKPDIGAVVASKIAAQSPIPYLTLGGQAQPRELAPLAAELGLTNQLSSMVVPQFAYPKPGSSEQNKGFKPNPKELQELQKYLAGSHRKFAQLHGSSGRNGQRISDFMGASKRADKLDVFLHQSSLADPKVVFRFSEKFPLAVQALKENFSQVAFLQTDGWDTHSNVAQQEGMYNNLFGGLNGLMNSLHQNKMVDDTLVLVLSEMGRTPRRNKDKGKDHWPYTSAMVIGGRVRGGYAYGQTDKEVRPTATNLTSGKTDPKNGTMLRTVHVLSSILLMMGIQPKEHFGDAEVLRALVG